MACFCGGPDGIGSNCPSAAKWRGMNRTSRDKRFWISWGGRLWLVPSFPETSSEDAMLETKTKGNVNVNVPFCICGGGAAPEPESAVDDEVVDGGSGGGISACAVMMCSGEQK